jgi:branched-chain amino acid transport system substrate-binding protein
MRLIVPVALAVLAAPSLAQTTQGVTRAEIVIGTMQDLSGPIAAFGKQVRNGMQLRVDELAEAGGVAGRKLVLKIEDHAYDPKRAVLAAQKLVNQDKIFAMVGTIGTAQNLAAMPIQFEKNVINFLPITAAREMYDPLHRLKFSFAATYHEQMRQAVPRLAKEKGAKKICAHYQDDEFGLEVVRGAEEGLKAAGMELTEKTSFKRGATEFSSQVARLRGAGCDFVVMGTLIRETIGTIGESRKTGFSPTFIGSSGAYTDLIHKLGGKAMDGFYTTHTVAHPYLDESSQPIRFWATKYKTKFDEDPTVFSVYGYTVIDYFIQAAGRAGANLSADSFVRAVEAGKFPADMFGSAEMSFSPTRRLGSNASRMSQIQDGRWKVVSPYVN